MRSDLGSLRRAGDVALSAIVVWITMASGHGASHRRKSREQVVHRRAGDPLRRQPAGFRLSLLPQFHP
ncbi:hypothetical protein, partial [Frankia sp. Cr2]|uniref:hypothetical protein n=1 Tax=Frankia sp. Cr2 TaxID=3073932 RepID=UPI002AD2E227